MEGVAFCAFQPVSAQAAIVFHMPDHRFDGAAPPNVPLQACGDAALEFAVVELDPGREGCTAIAQIHEHFLRLALCQDFHLLNSRVQGMPVVGIPGRLRMPTTNPSLCVVATDTFTPNS